MVKENKDRSVAYHEAGHAVVAWVFGLDIERVSIGSSEEYLGIMRGGSFDEDDYNVLEAHALTTLAGEVAVEILTGASVDWGQWWGSSGSDIDSYTGIAHRLGWFAMDGDVMDLNPVIKKRAAQTRSLIQERWAAVESVAAALLKEDEVSGEDAIRIMAETGVPGPVASVWADLLEERRREAESRATFEAARNDGRG